MRIRILQTRFHAELGILEVGAEHDVEEQLARQFIRQGFAEAAIQAVSVLKNKTVSKETE